MGCFNCFSFQCHLFAVCLCVSILGMLQSVSLPGLNIYNATPFLEQLGVSFSVSLSKRCFLRIL